MCVTKDGGVLQTEFVCCKGTHSVILYYLIIIVSVSAVAMDTACAGSWWG